MVIMWMSTLSVLTSMVTIYLHYKGSHSRVPYWLRVLAFKGLAKILFLTSDVKALETFFEESNNVVVPLGEADFCDQKEQFKAKPDYNMKDQLKPKSGYNLKADSELKVIQNQLLIITDTLQEQKADGNVADEWKLLAKIVDRTFFWVALIVVVVVSVLVSPIA